MKHKLLNLHKQCLHHADVMHRIQMIQKKHLNRAWHRQTNVSAARQTIIRADTADAETWFFRSLKRERTSNSNALPPTTFFIKKNLRRNISSQVFPVYLFVNSVRSVHRNIRKNQSIRKKSWCSSNTFRYL